MQFRTLIKPSFLLLALLAACSGGGGTANPGASPSPLGSVHVVVDTATGTDALAQFQLAAAFLEDGAGATTANLLPTSEMLTLADPSGEADGITLRAAPSGTYTRLHLVLAPGSGSMLCGNGTVCPIAGPVDLVVPIPEGLEHDARRRSWIEIGHQGDAPPANGTAPWNPTLRARTAGSLHLLDGLQVAHAHGNGVTALWRAGDDGPLDIEFDANCTFVRAGAPVDRATFLAGLGDSDDLVLRGRLFQDGRAIGDVVERVPGRRRDPRFIGRITELVPQREAFWMDVLAEARRGGPQVLAQPRRALVLAGEARITWSRTRRELGLQDLALGQLAKVEWTQRTLLQAGEEELAADRIEITGGDRCAPMQPEWEGAVHAIDLTNHTITVVPRGNDPIVVQGQPQNQVTVNVSASTRIERRERRGPGRSIITLEQIEPGFDRIWWRGTVVNATTIDATWVRVRDDR